MITPPSSLPFHSPADTVKITYGVQSGDLTKQRELPFVVGVLADFSGDAEKPSLVSRQFIEVNRENLHLIASQCRLEASWRALEYLVNNADSGNIKIRILYVSKKELYRDQLKAADFEQSILFKKLHDDIFGVIGAEPFGLLIGGYEFSAGNADLDRLEKLSQVAAAVHAPFLAAFNPIGSAPQGTKWRTFRQSEAARYVCLTAPQALSPFELGVRIICASARFGWYAKISGREDAFVETCHQPAIYENAESTATARLAADLRYVLSISRFVHYLRVIIRDQQGGSVPHAARKQMLNDWIAQYVSDDGTPTATRPLGSAYIDIPDRPGSSGFTTVSLYASPRFQLDALSYNIRALFPLPIFW